LTASQSKLRISARFKHYQEKNMLRLGFSLVLSILFSAAALAESPSINSPLPALSIEDKGELVLQGKDVGYSPWKYESVVGEVHVLQYFAGTQSASDSFKPLTDALTTTFPDGGYHVTTIINLDAAMWGTGGMVSGKAKSSKKEFPDSTMVLDEDGVGAKTWGIDKKGALLVVMDKSGSVIHLGHATMSESDVTATLSLIESAISS
jgi:YtfJ family uncharacterized protein